MKKFLKGIVASLFLVVSLTALSGCVNNHPGQQSVGTTSPTANKEMKAINDSDKARVKGSLFSLTSSYKVDVGDKKYTLTGDFIHWTGDTLKLKNSDGEVILYEEQEKRWGVKLNRMASVYSGDGELIGYIGEDNMKNLLSLLQVFYIYDKDGNELAKVKEDWSLVSSFTISDKNGPAYSIKGKLLSLTGDYTITRLNDKTEIPMSSVILVTAIQDAISAAAHQDSNK